MAADTKAQAIRDAAGEAIGVLRRMRTLSDGVLKPVAGSVEPHSDTITSIKEEMVDLYDEWDIAKAAVDAAKTA